MKKRSFRSNNPLYFTLMTRKLRFLTTEYWPGEKHIKFFLGRHSGTDDPKIIMTENFII